MFAEHRVHLHGGLDRELAVHDTGESQMGNGLRPFGGKGTTSPGDSPNRTTTSPEIRHPAVRVTSSLRYVLAGSRIARRTSDAVLSAALRSEGVLGNVTRAPLRSMTT